MTTEEKVDIHRIIAFPEIVKPHDSLHFHPHQAFINYESMHTYSTLMSEDFSQYENNQKRKIQKGNLCLFQSRSAAGFRQIQLEIQNRGFEIATFRHLIMFARYCKDFPSYVDRKWNDYHTYFVYAMGTRPQIDLVHKQNHFLDQNDCLIPYYHLFLGKYPEVRLCNDNSFTQSEDSCFLAWEPTS